MKVYTVVNNTENYSEVFYDLPAAKKAMVEHNAKGYITKVYSNGTTVNCGEIKLRGSNKTFIANSGQTIKGY
jgi:hypothetical protein